MQTVTLLDTHADSAAERRLLAAIARDPDLRARLHLVDELFHVEALAWGETLVGTPPAWCLEEEPSADPSADAAKLVDAHARRQLRVIVADHGQPVAARASRVLQEVAALKAEQPLELRPASAMIPGFLARYEKEHAEFKLTGRRFLGMSTGIPELDEKIDGLSEGLYTLEGPPTVGKTTLALQIAMDVTREAPVLYLSFENSPENIQEKALCALARIDRKQMKRRQHEPAMVRRASEMWKPVAERLYIVSGTSALAPMDVTRLARQAMKRHQAERCLVVVDYLQLWAKCCETLARVGSVREKVDLLLSSLSTMVRELRSPVLVIVSQNREAYNGQSSAPRSGMGKAKESGDIEYTADVMLALEEAKRAALPDKPGEIAPRAVDLRIVKQRDGERDAVVQLTFLAHRGEMRSTERNRR